jgi:hypothetical protein
VEGDQKTKTVKKTSPLGTLQGTCARSNVEKHILSLTPSRSFSAASLTN